MFSQAEYSVSSRDTAMSRGEWAVLHGKPVPGR